MSTKHIHHDLSVCVVWAHLSKNNSVIKKTNDNEVEQVSSKKNHCW
jgi:hypothetical protein